MFLVLGAGEPSYVPDAWLMEPRDQVDLDDIAFLQCYGRDLLQWKIICYFAIHPDDWQPEPAIAGAVGESPLYVAAALSRLVRGKLLQQRIPVTGPIYRLSAMPLLRRATLRVGGEWQDLIS